MLKKISKKVFVIFAVLLIGGFGGVIADRYIFPYLGSTSLFKKYDFLKKGSENVTVINKTEQVFVKEETSIAKISNQVSSSVVSIVSYPGAEDKGSMIGKYGTGLIVTSDGLIMAYIDAPNPNSAKYKVIIADGSSYDAEISGQDSYSNLFFLKISASNLPAVSFGNSDDIKSGEKVIAIGTAQNNLNHEYAAGLISNFNPTYNLGGKALSSSEKLEGIFETDLNSRQEYVGGPVVDYMGQVIGVIGVNFSDNEKDFFVIPSNKISKIVNRAIRKELENNPVLGVYYIPLTKGYALINNSKNDVGALIYSASGQQGLAIIAGSPAQKAGLRLNDIITKVNDQPINAANPFSDLLYQYKKGDLIDLTVIRDEQEVKISVQL